MLRKWAGDKAEAQLLILFSDFFSLSSSAAADQDCDCRLVPVVQSSRGCCLCVLEHADKKSNLNNNNKGGRIVFLPPVERRPEVRLEVLVSEESAWQKGCDCLCNVIVVMAGQGIAVVEWKTPAVSPCGSLCGCSRSWSIPMCRWSHHWECVSDGFVSSVGSNRPQGAKKSCTFRKISPLHSIMESGWGRRGGRLESRCRSEPNTVMGTEKGRREVSVVGTCHILHELRRTPQFLCIGTARGEYHDLQGHFFH